MSIEGGPFQCGIHDFETTEVEEWNKHCSEEEGHTEEGETVCRDCNQLIKFKNLPFHPFDDQGHKNISLQCPECSSKQSEAEIEVI